MKLKSILCLAGAALFAALPVIASDGNAQDIAAASATPATGQKYTCTMHPEIVKEKPDDCPKCGMKLVPKPESGKTK